MTNFLFRDETHQIIGCAMEVLNGIGHGFHEKIYENALVVAFEVRGMPYMQQRSFELVFKGRTVGTFVPDLICFGEIIVDTKTIDSITDQERGKMINYLKVTGLQVGLIINFKHRNLEWERIVLSRDLGN
ncbi:MAG: GxxExxY protein [Planctomycetaceae bacterium]|nr:GxxExxY protein [Planctomycetaceae bacterium]